MINVLLQEFNDAVGECTREEKKELLHAISDNLPPKAQKENAKGIYKALCILRDYLITSIFHSDK